MLLPILLSMSLAQAAVTGVIRDATGGAVPGAVVLLRTSAGEQQTVTGPDGRFKFSDAAPGATLIVRAGGFAIKEQQISGSGQVEVVLSPAPLLETVTVTPTRTEQRLGILPASVHMLSSEDIRQSPAVVADDVLRRIPTFSLFRRTSSLSSHPTAQGVSLRGIGPSGVSRTLVLLDGVPFNDPFGGWVYWTRVPLESTERIEVVDGSSSSLYGNYAMGGVINIVSSRAAARTFELKAQYGNLNSPNVDLFGSDVWGRVGLSLQGSLFETDGYPVVAADERGLVDTKASVEFRNFNAKADYNPTSGVNLLFRGGYFREERLNGKVSTIDGTPEANDTTLKSASGGVRIVLPDQSDLQGRIFTDFNTFNSTFLAVPNLQTRESGRMSLRQRVPTASVGGMAQWSKTLLGRHHFTVGADWRWVDADSNEQVLDFARGQIPVTDRVSGGTQQSVGAFAQNILTATPQLTVTLSARVDRWRNYDARHLETSVATGLPTANHVEALADTQDSVATPRVAALYRFTDKVSAWGDLSWGFRAPTLNELYREFRVGALTTLANNQLGPERLTGGELGLNVVPARNVTVRTTWFSNHIDNPVSNVTRTDLVNTQQRQNLGGTHIWGVQTDVDYRLAFWRFSGGYLFNRAIVTDYAVEPVLVGKFLPQVPTHRGSIQAAYSNPRYVSIAAGIQFVGRQFDDDQNVRIVPGETEPGLLGFGLFDLTASRWVHPNFQVFVGVQNLFDRQYFVGTLPTTIGSPRLVHGGVRVRLGGR